jgi:hypothetical protein
MALAMGVVFVTRGVFLMRSRPHTFTLTDAIIMANFKFVSTYYFFVVMATVLVTRRLCHGNGTAKLTEDARADAEIRDAWRRLHLNGDAWEQKVETPSSYKSIEHFTSESPFLNATAAKL